MLGTLFSGIVFIGKHSWPFIREWLFKSKSFKSWLKRHAAQLFYFALICVMVFVCYHLFLAATQAHAQRNEIMAKLVQIQSRYDDLEEKTQSSRDMDRKKAAAIIGLTEQNQQQAVVIVTYQRWMQMCGMDYSHLNADPAPSCRVTAAPRPTYRPPSAGTSSQPVPKPQKKKSTPKPKTEEPRSDLTKQVQELWGS